MEEKLTRRRLLLRSAAMGLGLIASGTARAAGRGLTPRQPEGPFYPEEDQDDQDTDLTRVAGSAGAALGTVVLLDGTVRTTDGSPAPGALVEIWQACASGRYNHPRDRNPAPLDPDFQYWGRTVTDEGGSYRFRTIKPGAYPNSPDWMRPPHIHFRVIVPGLPTLTTQMYFDGEALNAGDRILRNLSPALRNRVVCPFEPVPGNRDAIAGRFDIVIGQPGGEPAATPEID